MRTEATTQAIGTVEVVARLLDVAAGDPGYRDAYHERARAILGPLLPADEYQGLRTNPETIERLLREGRARIEAGQWQKVRELTGRVRGLRAALAGKEAMLGLAGRLYDAAEPVVDPFSPLLEMVFGGAGRDLRRTRAELIRAFAELEQGDPAWSEFYAGRRRHFDAMRVVGAGDPVEADATVSSFQTAALQALTRGDVDALERIARTALAPGSTPRGPHAEAPRADHEAPGEPFPPPAIRTGRELGLVRVGLAPWHDAAEFLGCCCVWRARVPDTPLAMGARVEGCTCGHACPPSIPATLKDALDLLIAHPFVTSTGARYLPRYEAEDVLVEDFPERADAGPSVLLDRLGLERRSRLSRHHIEQVFLASGREVLRHALGLDPQVYRLVCVPFDVYGRLAPEKGWGRQERLWTHFDGYQVWKAGRLRACVGGDAQFGGPHHLMSVAVDEEREGTLLRLAVLRRARFLSDETRFRGAP